MRQGNGTDLLGLNDPRSASIGIIYVAQNDDRKSVLAALITQEKLGRKQVAVVLPEQNQAFQRPGDFDDLKGLRNKLQTQIIFIAPPGPGPAEFARQRRFTVYSSLESYAKALRDEGLGEEDKKRNGFIAGPVKSARDSNPASDQGAPSPALGEAFVIGAGAAAAGAVVADASLPPQTPASVSGPSLPVSKGDEIADLPTNPIAGSGSSGAQGGTATGATVAGRGGPSNEKIIELSPVAKPGRTTKKLPIEGGATSSRVAAGVGMGAGVAVAAATVQRARNMSNPPQKKVTNKPRRHPVRNAFIFLVLLLLTLLIACGSLAYMQPKAVQALVQKAGLSKIVPNISLQPGVTVTIAPVNQVVSDSFVVSGIPGTADATKLQVSTRQLSYTTPSVTSPVTGTGKHVIPGVAARGTLNFNNGSTQSFTYGTTTPFTASNGQIFYLDAAVTIPAANPIAGTFGKATGTAHAATAGVAGNIAAGAISITNTIQGGPIGVTNQSAFAGGQDAQQYAFIQQGDVDAAVAAVQPGLVTKAQTGLKGQLQAGEQLTGDPQCTPKSSVDQPIGDTGKAIPSATATVSATCTAEAYKQADLNALAQAGLAKKVASDPTLGSSYGPVGGIVTTTTVQGTNNGIVSLLLSAKQVWAYQFTAAQKQTLADLIKGLSATQALTKLKSQVGVSNATIPTGTTTLPSDPTQITIDIQMPAGLSAGQGNITPTVPAGNGTPIQGNGSVPLIV